MSRVFPTSFAVIGTALLGLSLLGDLTSLGDYETHMPRAWEQFDESLAARARSYPALMAHAEQIAGHPLRNLEPAEAMSALYLTVANRFNHGLAEHNVFSNWLLWSLGAVHPAFHVVNDQHNLSSRGTSLFCSQSSYVLMSLANDIGITSRHVGLNGHVVMESFYDGAWHMYDPDMEVVVKDEAGGVMDVSALAADHERLAIAYSGPKAVVIPFIKSTIDNTFMSYPPGAWFVWKAHVLYLFELIADYLKYVLPTLLIAIAAYLFQAGRPRR